MSRRNTREPSPAFTGRRKMPRRNLAVGPIARPFPGISLILAAMTFVVATAIVIAPSVLVPPPVVLTPTVITAQRALIIGRPVRVPTTIIGFGTGDDSGSHRQEHRQGEDRSSHTALPPSGDVQ